MSVFPRFLCFIAFFGHFSAMGVQKYHKNFVQKNRVEKSLQKNRPKNPKPILSRIVSSCFWHVWAFLGEGSSKNSYKNIKQISLTLPSTTGVPDLLFLPAPWLALVGAVLKRLALCQLLITLKRAMGLRPVYFKISLGLSTALVSASISGS
jgi:hypothetical protein